MEQPAQTVLQVSRARQAQLARRARMESMEQLARPDLQVQLEQLVQLDRQARTEL
jgi:hypothetical protein